MNPVWGVEVRKSSQAFHLLVAGAGVCASTASTTSASRCVIALLLCCSDEIPNRDTEQDTSGYIHSQLVCEYRGQGSVPTPESGKGKLSVCGRSIGIM